MTRPIPITRGHNVTAPEIEAVWNRVVDVTMFGATGDGATDDTAAVQAAIDAAKVAGGTVYLPPGVYLVTTLTLPSGVVLMGAGVFATTVMSKAGANADVIQTEGFASLTGGGTTGGPYWFGVRDLTIHGNKANNTSGRGLAIYGRDYLLENLRIRECAGTGLYSEWSTAGGADPGQSDSVLSNVKVFDHAADGIVWSGPHDSSWDRVIVYKRANAGGTGVHVTIGGNNLVATGCHVWGTNFHTYAWNIEGTAHLIDCQGEGATLGQLLITASDTVVEGGHYFGTNVTGSPKGIILGTSTTGATRVLAHTKVSDCAGGGVDFTYAGPNNHISAVVKQITGSALVGTIPSDNFVSVRAEGSAGSVLQVPVDLRVNGHVLAGGPAPTIAVQAAAGTGATASVSGTDLAGTVAVNTGTSPAGGAQAVVTFARGFGATPKAVILTPANGPTAANALVMFVNNPTTGGFTLWAYATPLASTSYKWFYQVIG